jgi:hypothetical protein
LNYVFTQGATAVPIDLAIGMPGGSDRVVLEPRLGATLALADRGPGTYGWNFGAGLLFRASGKTGIRFDYTRRFLMGDEKPIPVTSITAGLTFALP